MHGALGSCHALDLPFVFGTLRLPMIDRFAGSGAAASALSEQMMDAWLSFAHTGDPGWAPYETGTRTTMEFGVECGERAAPMDEERALWARP
jgi:para-nitrobenzyl esterase